VLSCQGGHQQNNLDAPFKQTSVSKKSLQSNSRCKQKFRSAWSRTRVSAWNATWKMAVAFQAETRETADHRSFTSRDSFRKSTTITNTKPSWPLHPFTSQICDHFGTPRSTRPCHAFVFRPKTPRDRACRGSDRFATRTVQRLPSGTSIVNTLIHFLHSLHSFLCHVCFPLAQSAFALGRVLLHTFCIWGAWQEAKLAIMARPTRSSGRKPNCTSKYTQITRTGKSCLEVDY
jgi:hypothetical protein